MTQYPEARREGLIDKPLNDEVLIYDTANHDVHALNETSALVWQLANGKRSVSQIADGVARELHGQPDEELVWLALAQLSKAGLLKQASALPMPLGSLTRREFLGKAAVAAMVIPVVKTLRVPGPQQSSSCLPAGHLCISDDQCCSLACATTCACFVAGTSVLYGDGTHHPIEQVQVGELVLARDEKTGLLAPQPVLKTYIHNVTESFLLDFGDDSLGTTATHPFYTDTGWVKAIDLKVGTDCVMDNGSRVTVSGVEYPAPHPHPVYNLEVGGFHTYFVGDSGVWVHNRTTIQDIPTK